MKIDPNDPRLTAYALGELDAAERADLEALLTNDETARREVETIRRAATLLTDKLQSEPCPRLNPEQLAAINEQVASHEQETRAFPWWRILGWTTALGATAIVAAMTLPALNKSRPKTQTLTVQTPADHALTPTFVAQNGQPSSAPDTLSGGLRAISIAGDKIRAVGSAVKPGDRVDVLATYTDPDTHQESTQMIVQDVPVLALNNHKTDAQGTVGVSSFMTLGVKSEEAMLLAAADRTGALRVMVRAPEDKTIVSSSGVTTHDFQGKRTYEFAKSEKQPVLGDIPPQGTIFSGNSLALTGESESGVRNRVQWFGERRPADGITIYRGKDGQTIPFNDVNTEAYPRLVEGPFVDVTQNPLSTFSLDVDTASYANIRRFLNQGTLPPRDAVRIEEMLNYFPYDYPAPHRGEPFSLYVEMAECPWNTAHRLALVALKAKDIPARKAQPMNLVFLIDVSGSMADPNKLPLVKQALRLLVEQLGPRDRVAIVVYAGDSRVPLSSTSGDDKEAILEVIDSLEANGSTNGGAGIQSAYREAAANFIEGGVNRVILCTDGDFNVGVTDPNQLVRLIQQQMKSGVFLSVFGFGMGNLKDSTMQKLADKGNGNYAYIDNLDEARKALVEQMRGTLVTVAKDAKVQIEFNPGLVQAYRLIGYEKRMLRAQDFNNDRKDAGDVGAGHTVTALYEIVPAGAPVPPGVDPLKYQSQLSPRTAFSDELMTVKLRCKDPESSTSQLLTAPVRDQGSSWRGTSDNFRFAASVAAFGMVLRNSPYKGTADYDLALHLAEGARGRDPNGYRGELLSLIDEARSIHGNVVPDNP